MKDSAVLFIDSPGRKGLVASVSGLLYEPGVNILHAGHHRDHELGRFFMRVEDQVGTCGSGAGPGAHGAGAGGSLALRPANPVLRE